MPALAHKDDYYETPKSLFNTIQEETGLKFNIDVSANGTNKKCKYFINEYDDALSVDWDYHGGSTVAFNNPPRSKNGKFVIKALEQWKKHNIDIVQLLCWNDIGNKYGDILWPHILGKRIKVRNLGKVIFDKNGKPSEFPSRLTYFYAWYKSRG